MKKLVVFLIIFLCLPLGAQAQEVTGYLFYGRECAFCHREIEYLDDLQKQFGDNFHVEMYEVWHDEENSELLDEVRDTLGDSGEGVPFLVIGNEAISGFGDNTGDQIKQTVLDNIDKESIDIVEITLNEEKLPKDLSLDEEATMDVPLIGNTEIKETSSLLSGLLFGLADGFSMASILSILILMGILICVYDKKKRFKIGLSFIIGMSIMYLIFMLTGIDLMNIKLIVPSIVSIILIILGAIFVDSALKDKKEKMYLYKVKDSFGKLKEVFLIIGAFILGMIVSLMEFSNVLGGPVLYEKYLEINGITGFAYVMHIIFYALVFFASLFIMMFVLLNLWNLISKKLDKYRRLIGGILLLVVVILLLFIPDLII